MDNEQDQSVEEAILRHATQLFAEKGFDATSVQDIVDAGSLTKGALYYYYESKEELLFKIHERFITYELRQAEDILARNLPPADALKELMIGLVESIALFQPEVTVFFREMHRLSPDKFLAIKAVRDRYHQFFQRVVSDGQTSGAFRTDVAGSLQTLAVFGLCNWVYTWYRHDGTLSPREVGSQMAALLLEGMLAKA